jgi:hypothetical protein
MHGNLRHRKVGLVEKPLGPLDAGWFERLAPGWRPGVSGTTWTDALNRSRGGRPMPRHCRHQGAVRDEPECALDGCPCPHPCRREWRGLWPTPQARSETRKLGGRCRRIERHVSCLSGFHRTNWAAIDARRPHARKKHTIEAAVPSDACLFALIDVEHSGTHVRPMTESESGEHREYTR